MRPPGRLLALGRVVRPDVTCDTDVTCNTTQKATSTYLHVVGKARKARQGKRP